MKRRRTNIVGKLLHVEAVRQEAASAASSDEQEVLQEDAEPPPDDLPSPPSDHETRSSNDDHDENDNDGVDDHDENDNDGVDDHDENDNDGVNVRNEGNVYAQVDLDVDEGPADLLDDNAERFQYILGMIKKFALKGVAFTKVDELLQLLRPIYPNLPKTYRTLLDTPRDLELDLIGGHEGWYKGIKANLLQRVTDDYFINHDSIKIDVFIDSFAPFKSSPDSFTAILGCLVGEREPFIIQMSRGIGHPPLEEFFENFVEEANDLQENGFLFHGGQCPFEICLYFADAVGRQFIKCVTSTSSHHACERCNIVGYRYNRYYEVFPGPNGIPRTDESFARRRDRLHHNGDSPLEALGVNMISQIPLDGLHLIDEGCMKRWLKQVWGKFKIKRGKIGPREKRLVQQLIVILRRCIPSEFNRRTRSFLQLLHFKATEFRRILLYDGVRLFRHFNRPLYLNYLQLHCAITILSSPEHVQCENMLQIAQHLLNMFVSSSERLFGHHFVVYNIHSIKHLVDECRKHGTVIDFSAYKFESFFAVLKRALRSGLYPIQQLRNRDHERSGQFQRGKKEKIDPGEIILLQRESFQYDDEGTFYKKLQSADFCLGTSRRDCCFLSDTGEVVCISKIIHTPNGNVLLKGRKFAVLEDYYHQPIPSSMLDIFKVSRLIGREQTWHFENVKKKCMLLPDQHENEFICLPLVHCVDL